MPETELVGEACTEDEAVAQALSLRPDVVLMDLTLPGGSGIAATHRIVAELPNTAVLVVTMLEDRDALLAAMRAGARGYLLKGADGEQTLRAIRAVADGEAIFSPAMAQHLIEHVATVPQNRYAQGPDGTFSDLTDREREVLGLLARGLTNAAIAEHLFLSPKTVRNHVSNIFGKLQVADRSEAIVRAREAGWG
jgi:DNA-binding NarL/FixJ family response regulator